MDINKRKKSFVFFEVLLRIVILFVVSSVFLFPENSSALLKQGSRITFVVIVLVYSFLGKLRLYNHYLVWGILFSALCFINYLSAEYQSATASYLLTALQAIWTAFFLAVWLAESGAYEWLFNSIIVCSILYCYRMIRYIGTINWGLRKVGFILGTNVNTIGFRLAVACLLSLYLFYKYKKVGKFSLIYLLFAFLFVGFVLVSGSRRALVLCLIAFVLFSLSQAHNLRKRIKAFIGVFGLIFLLYFVITNVPQLYSIIGSRINNTIAAVFSSETVLDNGRDEMIHTGWNLFLQRPLLGWGMNNFRFVSGIDHAYSHNNYIELLFAMGLPAFIVYYYIAILCFNVRKVFEKKSLDRVFCLICLTFCLVSDLAAANYTSLLSHMLYAIPISMYLHKVTSG